MPYYGYGYFYDYWYIIFCIPPLIFALWASWNVKSTYKKYSRVTNTRGMTGEQAARKILAANGVSGVTIARIPGEMTDHFDPRTNVISLSDGVYDSNSVAAVGIAAHEAGHAVQHAVGYMPNKIRSTLVPIANFGSQAGLWLAIIGIIAGWQPLAYAGVIAFMAVTVFQLVTLPVEFNASHRALQGLSGDGTLSREDLSASGRVLRAAAMTYVAALAVSLGTLLRLLLMVSGGRNNRR